LSRRDGGDFKVQSPQSKVESQCVGKNVLTVAIRSGSFGSIRIGPTELKSIVPNVDGMESPLQAATPPELTE
jgi:hypothetical protein